MSDIRGTMVTLPLGCTTIRVRSPLPIPEVVWRRSDVVTSLAGNDVANGAQLLFVTAKWPREGATDDNMAGDGVSEE